MERDSFVGGDMQEEEEERKDDAAGSVCDEEDAAKACDEEDAAKACDEEEEEGEEEEGDEEEEKDMKTWMGECLERLRERYGKSERKIYKASLLALPHVYAKYPNVPEKQVILFENTVRFLGVHR